MHFNNTTIIIIIISVLLIVIGLVCFLSKKKDESFNDDESTPKKSVTLRNFTFGGSTIQGTTAKLGWFLKEDLGGKKNIIVNVSADSNNMPYSISIFNRNDVPLANMSQTSGRNSVVIPADRFDDQSFPISVMLYTPVDTVINLENFILTIGGTDSTSVENFIYVPDYQPLTSLGMDLRYPEGSYNRINRTLYPELKYVFD